MQKLSKRQLAKAKKNTPPDTPLVGSNCDPVLNSSEGRNSVQDRKTFDNNSEVDQRQHRGGTNSDASHQKLLCNVYVTNKDGKPLMSTTPRMARKLLKGDRAHVIQRKPFTIQLNYQATYYKQEVELGIDIGYKNIGISVKTDKKEVFAGELELRTDIVKLNIERRMYRKNRRSRNTWYRPARFLNRKNRKGKLPPSIQHKIDSHIKFIEKVAKIIPISKIIIEKAKFDIQKVMNPEISGVEYQNGPQKDYDDVKAYVRARDNYQCQNKNCKYKKEKNLELHVHHLNQRKDGGSDRPENLITVCKFCHDDFHDGRIKFEFIKPKSYKEATCMNMIRKRIIDQLREIYDQVEITYGTETKRKRLELNLEKSHINDAFVIAGGTDLQRSEVFYFKQKRRNNRGFQINHKNKILIRKKRYKFQRKDLVLYEGKEYEIYGGKYKERVVLENGTKNGKTVKIDKVKLIKYRAGIYAI